MDDERPERPDIDLLGDFFHASRAPELPPRVRAALSPEVRAWAAELPAILPVDRDPTAPVPAGGRTLLEFTILAAVLADTLAEIPDPDFDGGLSRVRLLRELFPRAGELLAQEGGLLLRAGRPGEAAWFLEEASRRPDADPELHARAALAWAQVGDPEAGRVTARRAVVRAPQLPISWRALIQVLAEWGPEAPGEDARRAWRAELGVALARARALAPPEGDPELDELARQLAQGAEPDGGGGLET